MLYVFVELSVLIEKYSNAIANGAVPHVQSAFECIEVTFIEEQHVQALYQYKSEISKTADKASLENKHAQVFVKVKENFLSIISTINDEHKKKYLQLLEVYILQKFLL